MWRLAKSLVTLRSQLNELYPNRNKASDGTISDAAHQAQGSASDHNAWVKDSQGIGVVTAFDITHDPSMLDNNKLADWLVDSQDDRIKYIIWNRRIWEGSWRKYRGANEHTKHLHLSVSTDPNLYDSQTKWKVGGMFPNIGDLTNFYNRTGWPGHVPNQNDVAYWTTGTGNDGWAAGADNVWKDLIYSVTLYVLEHPSQPVEVLKPGIYKVN